MYRFLFQLGRQDSQASAANYGEEGRADTPRATQQISEALPFDLALGGQGVTRTRGARFYCHRILIVDRSRTAAICGSSGLTSPTGETSIRATVLHLEVATSKQRETGGR